MKTLHVRAKGKALCPDYEALEGGVLRFIGRRHDPSLRPNGGWVPLDAVVEVPHRIEYLQELRADGLEPADEATAQAAGIPFRAPPTEAPRSVISSEPDTGAIKAEVLEKPTNAEPLAPAP